MNIEKRFLQKIKEYDTGGRLAIAVSGGEDSMCLLWLCLKHIKKDRLVVVCINHSIRKEAEKEMEFVKAFCIEHGVEFMPFLVDVPKIAEKNKQSIELCAREQRRKIFLQLYKTGSVDLVLLAHHKSDTVESILFNIFRGCGINGLKGMKALSEGYIFRPLLEVKKDEIKEFVKNNEIPFMVDKSNFSNTFTRNYIRNKIIPVIKKRFSALDTAIVNLSDNCVNNSEEIIGHLKKNKVTNYNKSQIDNIKNLTSGKSVSLSGGVVARKEYDKIEIFKPKQAIKYEIPFIKEYKATEVWFGKYAIGLIPTQKREEDGLFFDFLKVPAGAVFRTRREGDIFTPFGGKTKKLKEYFIDKKIPKTERDNVPLLATDNIVLAICTVEISNKIRVDEGSKIMRLQLKKSCIVRER